MPKKKFKSHPLIEWILLSGILLFTLFVSHMKIFRSLELHFLDYRFVLRGPLDVLESPIVILAIDDQSDASTPDRWPWPRDYFAHVIENLNQAGVKVIGIDVEFEQADSHGPASDDRFAHALKKYSNVVLAGKISRTKGPFEITSIVPPYEKFEQTGTPWGLVSSDVDADGIFRRYLIALRHMDSTYVSFALQVLKIYHGWEKSVTVEYRPNSFVYERYEIPKYDSFSMLINYSGPARTFPVYPFDNVLDDEEFDLLNEYDMDYFNDPGDPEMGIPPGLKHSGVLKDKIVLIGATMQELHDDFPTPFLTYTDETGSISKTVTPGVEVHANALQTILSGQYLTRWGFWSTLFIYLGLMVLVYGITRMLSTFWAVIVTMGITLCYLVANMILFSHHHIIIPVTTPLLLIPFCFMGLNLYHYVLSQKEKKMIRGAFSHYVPEKVVAAILADPDMLKLGGEERVVTVLFSDISGFTTISEKLSPTELIHLLNDYLTEMSEIILSNNGIIDKFEGDAIMAEFGVPVHDDHHARMACKAALEMQAELVLLRKRWKEENKPQLSVRIGINTGEVVVGNMGSRDVFDYTVLGDHVNLGSRLEGANKFYGTDIIISEFTHQTIEKDFITRMLDVVRVKGKEEPIRIYELIGLKSDFLGDKTSEWLELFKQGTEYYQTRKWQEALNCFQKCLTLKKNDVTTQKYIKRCQTFKMNPPDRSWDGVTILTEK